MVRKSSVQADHHARRRTPRLKNGAQIKKKFVFSHTGGKTNFFFCVLLSDDLQEIKYRENDTDNAVKIEKAADDGEQPTDISDTREETDDDAADDADNDLDEDADDEFNDVAGAPERKREKTFEKCHLNTPFNCYLQWKYTISGAICQ